ncbi:MAG: hypothetical protein ACTHU0_09695 [Kofleriaceae bacterium]
MNTSIFKPREKRHENDFLDHILDGNPAHIVFTPDLGRALRRRAAERNREERREGWWS